MSDEKTDEIRKYISDELVELLEECNDNTYFDSRGPEEAHMRRFLDGIEKLIDAKIEAALRERNK